MTFKAFVGKASSDVDNKEKEAGEYYYDVNIDE